MHGHGAPPRQPQRPGDGVLALLRVLFLVLCLGSCGMLAWGALLRIALLTRRTRDWVYFAASVVVLVVALGLLVSDGTDDLTTWRGNTGMAVLLLMAVVVAVYFVQTDMRHFQTPPPAAPYAAGPPAGPSAPAPGYGYPPLQHRTPPTPPGPYGTVPSYPGQAAPPPPYPQGTPVPGPPAYPDPRQTPPPHQTPVPSPHHTPPPQPRPAARIDQVRAELDELSDYLRRQDQSPDQGQAQGYGPGQGQGYNSGNSGTGRDGHDGDGHGRHRDGGNHW
ncbi:hypothetical protein JNUCC64_12825 [Streptomyces sp. JNUCC 64]